MSSASPIRIAFVASAFAVIVASAGGAQAASRTHMAPMPPKRPLTVLQDVTETGSIIPVDSRRGELPLPIQTVASDRGGDAALVERANAALNSVTSMTADFTQIGGDGRKLSGLMYLQRPGKLRFEYDKPATLEIVSDGSTVLVRDRKLNTSDPYPISQTPLKFLLSSRIDLSREASVKSVVSDPDGVRIAIEDSSTLGGTSKITLTFDKDVTSLKRWRVVDPQGYTTTVSLSDIEKNRTIDPRVFMLNYSRPVE